MSYETVQLFTKNFFGENIDASIEVYKEGRLHNTFSFDNGFLTLRIPNDLDPGLYDLIVKREGGEYRITDFLIPLATHYFEHASIHSDLKLKGGNFKKEKWSRLKFNPGVFYYVNRFNDQDRDRIIRAVDSLSSEGLRWGGDIILGNKILIEAGEAYSESKIISWDNTEFDFPQKTSEIGIKDGTLYVGEEPDTSLGKIVIEGNDLITLETDFKYHPVMRGNDFFVLKKYLKNTKDISFTTKSEELMSGKIRDRRILQRDYSNNTETKPLNSFSCISPVEVNSFSCKVDLDSGIIMDTDKLSLYAEPDYFLLISENVVIATLPRWQNPHVSISWSEDGVNFTSRGIDGHSHWRSNLPFKKDYVRMLADGDVQRTETNLKKLRFYQSYDISNRKTVIETNGGIVEDE